MAKAKKLAATELRRRFGKVSAQEQQQRQVRREEEEEEERRGGGGGAGGAGGAGEAGDERKEKIDNALDAVDTKRGDDDDDVVYDNDKVVLKRGPETPTPSKGRDWEKEIIAGVHAVPSMNHLHIHILSRDRYSECVKHRKHYNSFATRFMVPLEDFPLDSGDKRRWPGREGFLDENLKCWRCGRDFGRSFVQLKSHLKGEFEAWKRE